MPMLPLTFLFAIPLMALAVWLGTGYWRTAWAPWLIAFVAMLALQLALIGIRYGYGVEGIMFLQPYSGVAIPPLALLAFKPPQSIFRAAVHLLPLLGMWVVARQAPHLIDSYLATITFGYALALAEWGSRRAETLSWVPLHHYGAFKLGLWASVATLTLSGTTDAIVALDFFATGGANTERIAAGASILVLAALLLALRPFLRSRSWRSQRSASREDRALLARLAERLERDALFRDPDLTLARLARRLGVSARQVSEAVNRCTGKNVSQYVNERRIKAVCDALLESDAPVTAIMLDAGFLTKSNFNREFRRVTGQAPTAWRKAQREQASAAKREAIVRAEAEE